MTVKSQVAPKVYDGDGVTTVYPVPFYFIANDDVKAIHRAGTTVTPWVEGTHYTLTGAGEANGGSLTIKTSPDDYRLQVGETLTIKLDEAFTQPSDYPAGGPFPARTAEASWDRSTMQVLQLLEMVGRCLIVPETDTATELQLPIDSERALKYLGFDAGGNPAAVEGTADITPISSALSAFISAASLEAARTVLGALEDVTTARGQVLYRGADGIEALDPSGSTLYVLKSGGVGGDPRWAAEGMTLEIRMWLRSAPPGGYLLLNGETVGDAGSGADHAGAGYETLFTLLWDEISDSWAPVVGGRGASAGDDWEAGKEITLPDFRDRLPIGAGSLYQLGETGGEAEHTLIDDELPTTTIRNPSSYVVVAGGDSAATSVANVANTTFGNDQPHNNLPPFFAVNWIVRI